MYCAFSLSSTKFIGHVGKEQILESVVIRENLSVAERDWIRINGRIVVGPNSGLNRRYQTVVLKGGIVESVVIQHADGWVLGQLFFSAEESKLDQEQTGGDIRAAIFDHLTARFYCATGGK